MAKNRKKKAKDKDEAAPASSPPPSASPPPASSGPVEAADIALKAGNFAAIRIMATGNDKKAQALLPMTQVDMGQVVVGLIAMLIVLAVAFFVLHGR